MHRGFRWVSGWGAAFVFFFSALTAVIVRARADAPSSGGPVYLTPHPECSYFGPEREKFVRAALGPFHRTSHPLTTLTDRVTRMLAVRGSGPSSTYHQSQAAGFIDSYIFAAFRANGIAPAPMTTDWEFIRRVTLDLTGRIPAPAQVLAFVADTSSNKRAKLIDRLLANPEWVDKWTMYFGDLYGNTANKPSNGLIRFPQGRNAFYDYLHAALANNKPYNQIATDLITAADPDSYNNGPVNYLLGGYTTGGPVQDTIDQMTANVFDTFMGMTHVNCLLCHNGRGHLDSLSLWGSNTTRYQAWQLASFLSHTSMARTVADPSNKNVYYWSLLDNQKGHTTDYALDTTSGNRPARVAPPGCKSSQPCWYVAPQYIFTGSSPKPGQDYRAALAQYITGDFQFARATVNYIWAQFFGMGIVDPPDTFDPSRLDPNNPPATPWTLQPSNPQLLQALAEHFIQSGYDLRALMREIANSHTYQLSSRYPDQWNVAWEPYFARKFVRRLWGEEIHDAIVDSSGLTPSYAIKGFTDLGYPNPSHAMQFPDVVGTPTSDGNVLNFLNSFLRGNRDDQPRKSDGSILQALSLMNNPFVERAIQPTSDAAAPLIAQNLNQDNTSLIDTLYLTILSRYPTTAEMAVAQSAVPAVQGTTRNQAVQDLVWLLYNKVDFVFNY